MLESATELSGLLTTSKLFCDGATVVIANEDAAAVAVEGGGGAETVEQAVERAEIAFGGFRRGRLGRKDFIGGIVLHAQGGEMRAAAFEPVVGGAIELDEFAFASRAQAALVKCGQAAQGLAAEGETFLLDELLREMMIIEACVGGAHALRQLTRAGR